MNTDGGNALVYDEFAWKLADALLEDFKPFVRDSFYDAAKPAIAGRNVEAYRALACAEFDSYLNPNQLKTERQVVDLFKKFSFSQDVFTPSKLQEDSKRKFLVNQERLMNFVLDASDPVTRDIVWRARGWAEHILGEFNSIEVCERATFGKKSSVGVPMREACEGARYEPPISGSADHVDWFLKYYGKWNRPALNYAQELEVSRKVPLTSNVDCLEAVLVAKTWKSLRMIMPNTTLGTLYSSGVGRMIEERLRAFGFDIRTLQPVHGELARIGSVTGSLVTADQSMASDNITVKLIDTIFPWRWASALRFGRIERIALYGDVIESPTFATMGIGFTFPLQTLLFLVLLLAIRDHLSLGDETVVSVFGDDLVYATEMHPLVVDVFPKLGLVLNLDKTFASGHFRESCGQDYYRGYDVRPMHLASVEGQSAGKRRAEAYLYKTFNALMRRWSVYEVTTAAKLIRGEIQRVRRDDPLVVPKDFPDTAGIRYDIFVMDELELRMRDSRDKYGNHQFRYLAFEAETKTEERHAPYLFKRLRGTSQPMKLPFPVRGKGVVLAEPSPILDWVDDPAGTTVRSKLTGRRHRRLLAAISQQGRGRYRERFGVTQTWTP
jgi:hypothetical protein